MADYDDDDVTASSYRDVSDDVIAVDVTPGSTSVSSEQPTMIAGCLLYKFVVDMVNGLVCVLGLAMNLVAFAVFHKDTMKTSTSFLFQVASRHPSLLVRL